jgi:hypothetical protein
MGLSVGHCAFEVQPAWHLRSLSQMDAVGGHWALERHWTHSPVRAKQYGAAAPQCVLSRHATQAPVCGLQKGLGVPAQSALVEHPAHTPVCASHVAPPGQFPAVQAPWQV